MQAIHRPKLEPCYLQVIRTGLLTSLELGHDPIQVMFAAGDAVSDERARHARWLD